MTMNDEGLLAGVKIRDVRYFPGNFLLFQKMSLKIGFECVNYFPMRAIPTGR